MNKKEIMELKYCGNCDELVDMKDVEKILDEIQRRTLNIKNDIELLNEAINGILEILE